MARRLSVVQESGNGLGEEHTPEQVAPGPWTGVVEGDSGDIQVSQFPKRKSAPTTSEGRISSAATTQAPAPPEGPGRIVSNDSAGSSAGRRQARTFLARTRSKNNAPPAPLHFLSSRGGSSSSTISSINSNSNGTFAAGASGVHQRSPAGRPPVSPTDVPAGGVFPVGCPMDERRAAEVALVKRFERSRWVRYAMGLANPPGPITNLNLFLTDDDDDGAASTTSGVSIKVSVPAMRALTSGARSFLVPGGPRLAKGLKLVRDYRAVHPLVWYMLRNLYGADEAPDICRWKTDIYSDPVLPGRKLKVAEDNQTKAAYEVSRIAHIARDKLVAAKDQMAKEAGSSSDSSDSG